MLFGDTGNDLKLTFTCLYVEIQAGYLILYVNKRGFVVVAFFS